ncbi:organic cation transporter protein-like isoform X2 [Spodoptera litura]|uniref:Organic cation transporter protein-like isoform X2 n=1 Tax=Spodoptera litura TaxID=69820 RepID=A0A9J7IUY6_SPOLT|nr:organic cation transporter protein-like isoform X2 [Spodoptera litura]
MPSNTQSTQTRSALSKEIDIDALIVQLGQFGRYQRWVFAYLGLAIIFTSIYNCQYVFNAAGDNYRCKVPECEQSPPVYSRTEPWRKFALPSKGYNCYRKIPIGKSCAPESFSNTTRRCYSWVYEGGTTIVAEFDLACQEWKRTLVGTIHNFGVFLAIPLTAAVSDTYGRRFALIGTCVAPAVFGLLRAFCRNYVVYLFLEFVEALVGNGTYSTAFIIALEIVGLKMRVLGGNIIQSTYAVGQILTAIIAWVIPYWRTFTIVIFTPSFLFIFYIFFVEESFRWLMVKGHDDEAARILLKVAKWNNAHLLPETKAILTGEPSKFSRPWNPFPLSTVPPPPPKETRLMLKVLKSRTMMFRIIVVSFWWISVTMIYYGLSINSVSLVGNKYVNYMMTAFVEIPGSFLCFMTLDRFGRKSSIMTSFFICGLSLLVLPIVKNPNLTILLTLVGKMTISLIFSGIYIYTVELFPTSARHRMLGICSMTGRIGSMCAPQTPLLVDGVHEVPPVHSVRLAGWYVGAVNAANSGDAAHEAARHHRAGGADDPRQPLHQNDQFNHVTLSLPCWLQTYFHYSQVFSGI